MISKQTQGNGFYGGIEYNFDMDHKNEKIVKYLGSNGLSCEGEPKQSDLRQIAREFRANALLCPNVKKPVLNLFNSYPDEDTSILTDEKMAELAKEYLEKYACTVTGWTTYYKDGHKKRKPVLKPVPLEELQYIIYRHSEKNNQHTHTLLNLVSLKGEVLYTGNNWIRNEKICKEITSEHGLTWGKPKEKSDVKTFKFSDDEIRYKLARLVYEGMQECENIHDLPELLSKHGVDTIIKDDNNGNAVGISFLFLEHKFRGSNLGRRFSAPNIAKAIEERQKGFSCSPAGIETSKDQSRENKQSTPTIIKIHYPETSIRGFEFFKMLTEDGNEKIQACARGKSFFSSIDYIEKGISIENVIWQSEDNKRYMFRDGTLFPAEIIETDFCSIFASASNVKELKEMLNRKGMELSKSVNNKGYILSIKIDNRYFDLRTLIHDDQYETLQQNYNRILKNISPQRSSPAGPLISASGKDSDAHTDKGEDDDIYVDEAKKHFRMIR